MELENRPVTEYLKLVRLRPDQKFNINDFDENFVILDRFLQYAHEKMDRLPEFTITETDKGYTLVATSNEAEISVELKHGKSLFDEWKENHPDAVEITFDDFVRLYVKGDTGNEGKNSYEVWLDQGNTGSYEDYHESLRGQKGDPGKDAKNNYELWLDAGNEGTLEDYQNYLKGEKGDTGKSNYELWLEEGNEGTLEDFFETYRGSKGNTGKDSYELWIEKGNTGTFEEFLETYRGQQGEQGNEGKNSYEVWLDQGNTGSYEDYHESLRGDIGKNLYEIWLEIGNTGTFEEFMELYRGPKGNDGLDGIDGNEGKQGEPGKDGKDGRDGTDGNPGKDSYELWIEKGNTGTFEEFLETYRGQQGDTGKSNYELWLDAGNEGTLEEFFETYRGHKGDQGDEGKNSYETWLAQGNEGSYEVYHETLRGGKGEKGDTGKDNFELWLEKGNTGSYNDYYESLRGNTGKDSYELWLEKGNTGTFEEFLETYRGKDGKNLYELWLEEGNEGTLDEFLENYRGPEGQQGEPGKNNYELWLDQGNEGSYEEFFELSRGPKGNKGDPGETPEIIIDTQINETSNNPISNSAVYARIAQLIETIESTYISKTGSSTITGSLTAEKFIGALEGNANTASKFMTSINFTIGDELQHFDGSENISFSLEQIGASPSNHTHNYAGSSSVGGSANSAVKLETERMINGTKFNGTSDITTAKWGTSRNFALGNSNLSIDGSKDIVISLDAMGAAPKSHDHTGIASLGNTECPTGTEDVGPEGMLSFLYGYNGGWASGYANIINLHGQGKSQICCEWTGVNEGGYGSMYYRNKRDNIEAIWSDWVRLLDSHNWSDYAASKDHTHPYLPLSGYTMNESAIITFNSPLNGTSLAGVYGYMASNDCWRVVGGGTVSDVGYLEIATTDNGDEPIYVRQYTGNTLGGFDTCVRTLTLLDGSGNTIIPGDIAFGSGENIGRIGHNGDVYIKTGSTASGLGGWVSDLINGRLAKTGGELTGLLKVTNPTGEGGEIRLDPAQNDNTNGGITLDNFYGAFRLFGAGSRDGSTKTGSGAVLAIYPFDSKIDISQYRISDRLFPLNSNSYDIGSTSYRWRNLYIGTINASGNITGAKVYNAVWNDYAEYFEKGEETEIGDIIALDPNSKEEKYIKATSTDLVVGVHSDTFGHIIGGKNLPKDSTEEYEAYNNRLYIPVGMTGRVKCKVIGKISKMDEIYASETPGVGRAYKEGDLKRSFVGYALEDYDKNTIGIIKILLK